MRDEDVHRKFDRYANGDFQIGKLPSRLQVQGKVAWYVFHGAYSGLGNAWAMFPKKFLGSKRGEPSGPPGEVYVCDPDDRKGAREAKLLTVLWIPLMAE